MSELQQRLRNDLTAAMKSRDVTTTSTLRMVLTALTNEEVAGSQAKQLDDADVQRVLAREVKKRTESAEVYATAGRQELAERERAEIAVIERYLPTQLTDDELHSLVTAAFVQATADGGEAPTMKQMGQLIKSVQVAAAGRADGSRIAAAVKSALS